MYRSMKPAALFVILAAATTAHALDAERWDNLSAKPSVIALQQEGIATRAPDALTPLTAASLSDLPAGTGVRVRAILTPPTTGPHTLYISGAHAAALWLSPDDSRFAKQRVAWLHEATNAEQWAKFPTQATAAIELTAETPYYLEAQVMASAANGHLALGWKTPGSETITLIPIEALATLPQDSADLDDNNLPDSWEASTGLAQSSLPGASSEYGDPDNDGITNFEEYLLGSDPLEKDARADGITRDTWHGVGGHNIRGFTHNNRARFLSYPTEIAHRPNIDDPSTGGKVGTRYRGFLVAPVTGAYRLWIAGNNMCELWFSDGTVKHPDTGLPLTNRFGKQLLAHNNNPADHFSSSYQGFDRLASQRTRLVHLTEGEHYYLEVLHLQGSNNSGHISVAWQVPGQAREIIPATAFLGDIPDDDDLDGDFLPDSWEIAVGLDPTDNGLISNKQGQYGDFDNDGLTNLEEFQYGTDPKSADTDGDGLTDYDEIFFYGTDPLVSNILAPALVATPNPHQYTNYTGGWTSNADGSLSAWDPRGTITYSFTLTEPGIHEITLTGAAIGNLRVNEYLPIAMSIGDSAPFVRGELFSKNGGQGTLSGVTPLLAAGTYTLTIDHENFRSARRLRIDSIQIHRLGGQDLDENGIPDWAEQNALAANALTRVPEFSRTSPASIEGISQNLTITTVEGSLGVPPTPSEPQSLELSPSINNTFFADVPLYEESPTTLTASFLNGLLTKTYDITWIATNLLEFHDGELHIRQNDALRITAFDPVEGASGSFTLESTTLQFLFPTEPTDSDSPIAITFDTPGTHTLTATWTPTDGPDQIATLELHVHTADFGPAHSVRSYSPRTWTPPTLALLHQVEHDERLIFVETTADPEADPRTFSVNFQEPGNHHVIARIPGDVEGAPAAILARGTINGFHLAYLNATVDAQIIHQYDDGTYLMSGTLIAVNLPSDVLIRLRTHHQGATFSNGSDILWLNAADFNANGSATIYYEWAGEGDPKLCNHLQAFIEQ